MMSHPTIQLWTKFGPNQLKNGKVIAFLVFFGGSAGSGAAAPLPVWRAASSLYFEVVIPWGVTTQNFKPLPWKMAEKKQNEYAEPFEKLTFNLICILSLWNYIGRPMKELRYFHETSHLKYLCLQKHTAKKIFEKKNHFFKSYPIFNF